MSAIRNKDKELWYYLDQGHSDNIMKLYLMHNILNGISPEEAVRLAFTNPSFQTIRGMLLQAELFNFELRQLVDYIHNVTSIKEALHVAVLELNELVNIIEIEHEKNEEYRRTLVEYCDTYLNSTEQNIREEIERLRELAIKEISQLISNLQNTLKILNSDLERLYREERALVSKEVAVNRDIAMLMFDAFKKSRQEIPLEINFQMIDKSDNTIDYCLKIKNDAFDKALSKWLISNPDADPEVGLRQVIKEIIKDEITSRNPSITDEQIKQCQDDPGIQKQIDDYAKILIVAMNKNLDVEGYQKKKEEKYFIKEKIKENREEISDKIERKEQHIAALDEKKEILSKLNNPADSFMKSFLDELGIAVPPSNKNRQQIEGRLDQHSEYYDDKNSNYRPR